jgi:acid stress chaperone HdeB
MRAVLAAALLAAAAVLPPKAPVRAEVINMATITCQELLAGKPDDIGVLIIWLHGYYSGRGANTTLDTDALTRDSEKIGQHCAQNPTITVMQAIERIFR